MVCYRHTDEQEFNSNVYLIGNDVIAVIGKVAWVYIDRRWIELKGRLATEFKDCLDGVDHASQPSLLRRVKLKEARQIVDLLENAQLSPVEPKVVLQRPQLLFLELTDRCNLKCRHCYARAGPNADSTMERAFALSIIEESARLKFERMQLTGGEALLHPKLAELTKVAFERGIKNVEIFTNGTLLTNSLLDALPRETRFALSLYSGDPAHHDRITGVEGSFKKTLAAIELIRRKKFKMRLSTVIMEENAGDWEETQKFLGELGIPPRAMGVSSTMNVGRGDYFPIPADSLASCVDETEEQEMVPSSIRPGKVAISATGDVFPCIFARWLKLGNRNERSLADILEHPEVLSRSAGMSVPDRWVELSERLACPDCRLLALALMEQRR